jgi:hypothetical protein
MKDFKRIAKTLGVVGVVGLAVGLVVGAVWLMVYIARLPESNCVSTPLGEYWAPDRGYKATVLEKDCNLGETFFYSIRIDANSPPPSKRWFVLPQLESDTLERNPPVVHWAEPHRLEVLVKTHTLAGTLTVHMGQESGQDLILVRRYEPSDRW